METGEERAALDERAEKLGAFYEKNKTPDPAIVSKLPRIPKSAKGKDKQKCQICGGYHEPGAFHLDYVGHAEATMALLEADPLWEWVPLAFTDEGLPVLDRDSDGNPIGVWGILTVHGHSRIGYGSVEMGYDRHGNRVPKPDAIKELIGDAIRNSLMRFGGFISLWAKSEPPPGATGSPPVTTGPPPRQPERQQTGPQAVTSDDLITAKRALWKYAESIGMSAEGAQEYIQTHHGDPKSLTREQWETALAELQAENEPPEAA